MWLVTCLDVWSDWWVLAHNLIKRPWICQAILLYLSVWWWWREHALQRMWRLELWLLKASPLPCTLAIEGGDKVHGVNSKERRGTFLAACRPLASSLKRQLCCEPGWACVGTSTFFFFDMPQGGLITETFPFGVGPRSSASEYFWCFYIYFLITSCYSWITM